MEDYVRNLIIKYIDLMKLLKETSLLINHCMITIYSHRALILKLAEMKSPILKYFILSILFIALLKPPPLKITIITILIFGLGHGMFINTVPIQS